MNPKALKVFRLCEQAADLASRDAVGDHAEQAAV
jgi:hypothetical protein